MFIKRTEGNPAWKGGDFPIIPCYNCPNAQECGMRMWRYKEGACAAYTAYKNISAFCHEKLEMEGKVSWILDIEGAEAVKVTEAHCPGYCYWIYRDSNGDAIFQAEAVLEDLVTVQFWDIKEALRVLPRFYSGSWAQWSMEIDHPGIPIGISREEAGFRI